MRKEDLKERSAMFMTDEEYEESIEDKLPKPFISAVVGLIIICLVAFAAIMYGMGGEDSKPATPVLSFVTENETVESNEEVLTVNDMVNEFGNLFNDAEDSVEDQEDEEIFIGGSSSSGSSKKKVTSLEDARVEEKIKENKEVSSADKGLNATTPVVQENATETEPEAPEENKTVENNETPNNNVSVPADNQENEVETPASNEEDKEEEEDNKEEEKEDNGSEQDVEEAKENETETPAEENSTDDVEPEAPEEEEEEEEQEEENDTVGDSEEDQEENKTDSEPEVPEAEPVVTPDTGTNANDLNSNATATGEI